MRRIVTLEDDSTMSFKWFVLCWRKKNVWFIGPFDHARSAGAAGRKIQKAHDDNPCWNTIQLPYMQGVTGFAGDIINPSDGLTYGPAL